MAYAVDSKSAAPPWACGFKSHLRHPPAWGEGGGCSHGGPTRGRKSLPAPRSTRSVIPPAALAIALFLLSAGEWGSSPLREFAGVVASVTGARLTVENRMGDRLAFERGRGTVVEGASGLWGAIAIGDRVTVYWSLADTPRRARRVILMPSRSH